MGQQEKPRAARKTRPEVAAAAASAAGARERMMLAVPPWLENEVRTVHKVTRVPLSEIKAALARAALEPMRGRVWEVYRKDVEPELPPEAK